MIKPNHPHPMWAVHDTVLDNYGHPHATYAEARLYRNGQLLHLSMAERERLFPVVAVAVTMEPWLFRAPEASTQARLFDRVARHDNHQNT